MSTTVELGKATAEIARLRASIDELAQRYERAMRFSQYGPVYSTMADRLRALLDES